MVLDRKCKAPKHLHIDLYLGACIVWMIRGKKKWATEEERKGRNGNPKGGENEVKGYGKGLLVCLFVGLCVGDVIVKWLGGVLGSPKTPTLQKELVYHTSMI